MIYANAHYFTKAETDLPIEMLSSVSCYSLKSRCGATSWEVMTWEYRFPTYLHFPKGQALSYGLTLHLWDHIKGCTAAVSLLFNNIKSGQYRDSNYWTSIIQIRSQAAVKMKAGLQMQTEWLVFAPCRGLMFIFFLCSSSFLNTVGDCASREAYICFHFSKSK